MAQKVYVVFHDHKDEYTDVYEQNYDFKERFYGVFGTESDARGRLQDLVLGDYYCRYVDTMKIEDLIADIYGSWAHYNEPAFDVIEDKMNKIVVYSNGDEDTYYFREYEIST